MKTPLYCDNPVCENQIGTITHYDWGDRGCDPPDIDRDSDAIEGELGWYCSDECQAEEEGE